MALRNIVKIDRDKCDGCGQCIDACAEGAIELVDGKAQLVSEAYCDGLGACLGHCPQGAITIEQRQAAGFDEAATKAHLESNQTATKPGKSGCAAAGALAGGFECPGLAPRTLEKDAPDSVPARGGSPSQLSQWPVQLKLVPATAPYLAGAELLCVADCVPFAMGDFHSRLLRGRAVVVGCPKLDDAGFYVGKLAEIIKANSLKGLSVVHMEVPCCTGLRRIAQQAIAQSGVKLALTDITIDLRGNIIATKTF